MDIVLAVFLLLVGVGQSLLGLKKETSIESDKHRLNKILAWSYIVAVIAGISLFSMQKINEGKSESKLFGFLKSKNTEQLETLKKVISKTSLLLKSSDSIGKKLLQMNKSNSLLIDQYKTVNSQLSKQIDLDLKKFYDDAPILTIRDNECKWIRNDSSMFYLQIFIRNVGKRKAKILDIDGNIVYFNDNFKVVSSCKITGDGSDYDLPPVDYDNSSLGYFSDKHISVHFSDLNKYVASIFIKVQYKDVAMNKDSTVYIFSGWSIKEGGFCKLKKWINLEAIKWIDNNQNLNTKKLLKNYFSPKNSHR